MLLSRWWWPCQIANSKSLQATCLWSCLSFANQPTQELYTSFMEHLNFRPLAPYPNTTIREKTPSDIHECQQETTIIIPATNSKIAHIIISIPFHRNYGKKAFTSAPHFFYPLTALMLPQKTCVHTMTPVSGIYEWKCLPLGPALPFLYVWRYWIKISPADPENILVPWFNHSMSTWMWWPHNSSSSEKTQAFWNAVSFPRRNWWLSSTHKMRKNGFCPICSAIFSN